MKKFLIAAATVAALGVGLTGCASASTEQKVGDLLAKMAEAGGKEFALEGDELDAQVEEFTETMERGCDISETLVVAGITKGLEQYDAADRELIEDMFFEARDLICDEDAK